MNEQENAALVHGMYDAFARGDLQAILDLQAPDTEWVFDGPQAIPYAGRWTGVSGVQNFIVAMVTTLDNPVLSTDHYIAQGDRVVTTGRFSAVVKATGKQFDCAIAHVLTFKDGKVAGFIDFADTARIADAYTA
jgi:uncharacterized protein